MSARSARGEPSSRVVIDLITSLVPRSACGNASRACVNQRDRRARDTDTLLPRTLANGRAKPTRRRDVTSRTARKANGARWLQPPDPPPPSSCGTSPWQYQGKEFAPSQASGAPGAAPRTISSLRRRASAQARALPCRARARVGRDLGSRNARSSTVPRSRIQKRLRRASHRDRTTSRAST